MHMRNHIFVCAISYCSVSFLLVPDQIPMNSTNQFHTTMHFTWSVVHYVHTWNVVAAVSKRIFIPLCIMSKEKISYKMIHAQYNHSNNHYIETLFTIILAFSRKKTYLCMIYEKGFNDFCFLYISLEIFNRVVTKSSVSVK